MRVNSALNYPAGVLLHRVITLHRGRTCWLVRAKPGHSVVLPNPHNVKATEVLTCNSLGWTITPFKAESQGQAVIRQVKNLNPTCCVVASSGT